MRRRSDPLALIYLFIVIAALITLFSIFLDFARLAEGQVYEPTDRRESHPYTVRVNGEAVHAMGLPIVEDAGAVRLTLARDAYRQLHRQVDLQLFESYDVEWIWWEIIDDDFRIGHGIGYEGVTLDHMDCEDERAVLRFGIGPTTLKLETRYETVGGD